MKKYRRKTFCGEIREGSSFLISGFLLRIYGKYVIILSLKDRGKGILMAKKLEEECGTKVLMNVPEVDQVDLSAFSEGKAKETRRFHESIPAYNRTPLVQLRGLGGKLGVKGIFVKNEAERFGMKAFKGLGGTYAMFRILCRELGLDPGKVDFSEFQKADVREKTAK